MERLLQTSLNWGKDGVTEPGGSGKEQKILTRINVSV